jgi:16S rRNA (guanine1207-N2)-methyltransferase
MAEVRDTPAFEWGRLRRWPDAEAPNLFAADAADRLLIDTAASALAEVSADDVVIVGDAFGALTLAAADAVHVGGDPDGVVAEAAARAGTRFADSAGLHSGGHSGAHSGGIRVHQDSVVSEKALAANAAVFGSVVYRTLPLGAELTADARTAPGRDGRAGPTVVLLRLPKSLDALDEQAATLAAGAAAGVSAGPSAGSGASAAAGVGASAGPSDDVIVFAGGMQKHLTPAMNEVLGRYFGRVDVGLARQKARVLTVREPRRAEAEAALAGWPRRERHPDIAPGLTVCAHGGAFAGTRIDIGTRLLLAHLDEAAPDARSAVDLACGTGVLATTLALRRPGLRVVASDVSWAAAASARATAEANGVADRVEVRREDAGEGIRDGSADLVVLNPPFHTGAALDLRVGRMLVTAAARLLAPGGELWTVFNSHLDYRPALSRAVGPTRQVDRNPKFTLTVSVRR